MTPDEMIRQMVGTAEQDQATAGSRTMASVYAAFYLGLLADGVPGPDAVAMAVELIRCSIGDHKPRV